MKEMKKSVVENYDKAVLSVEKYKAKQESIKVAKSDRLKKFIDNLEQ